MVYRHVFNILESDLLDAYNKAIATPNQTSMLHTVKIVQKNGDKELVTNDRFIIPGIANEFVPVFYFQLNETKALHVGCMMEKHKEGEPGVPISKFCRAAVRIFLIPTVDSGIIVTDNLYNSEELPAVVPWTRLAPVSSWKALEKKALPNEDFWHTCSPSVRALKLLLSFKFEPGFTSHMESLKLDADLTDLLLTGKNADVVVKMEDGKVEKKIHSWILSMRCPLYRTEAYQRMHQGLVDWNKYSSATGLMLLVYLYTGQTNFSSNQVTNAMDFLGLVELAASLQLHNLAMLQIEILASKLTEPSEIHSAFKLAHKFKEIDKEAKTSPGLIGQALESALYDRLSHDSKIVRHVVQHWTTFSLPSSSSSSSSSQLPASLDAADVVEVPRTPPKRRRVETKSS